MTEAFHTKTASLGARHFETAASQHYLGIIYMELEDTETALRNLIDALNVRVECFGTEHQSVAGTKYCLGQTHYLRDEFKEAMSTEY